MSAFKEVFQNEKDLKKFENDLKSNFIKRSAVSIHSDSSYDRDSASGRINISLSDELSDERQSKFFIYDNTKDIEPDSSNRLDFIISSQSNKSSSYLSPTIYRPAYLYKKYKYADLFRIEVLNIFLYTFLTTLGQILCILFKANPLISYLFRVLLHSMVLLFCSLLFNSEEFMRSINVNLETIMINTVLFNYSILDVFVYFSIQVCVSFTTNLLLFLILYDFIQGINVVTLSISLVQVVPFIRIPSYSMALLYIFHIFIYSMLSTQIVDRLTSIEYKKIVIYKSLLFFLFNLVTAATTSYISSMTYNIATASAIVVFKSEIFPISYNDYSVIYFLAISGIVSFGASWIGYYRIKNIYNKYIEI